MRVISGIRRGLKLKTPEGLHTRPTTDRVKESLFNILQFELPCAEVLDLFAGSGALGIECLSRRCGRCTFVDSNPVSVSYIQENLQAAKFTENSEVLRMEASAFLKQCTRQFDLIFLDPPYNKGFLDPVIQQIFQRCLLNKGGIIVTESETGGEAVTHTYYQVRRTAVYGKTVITMLQG